MGHWCFVDLQLMNCMFVEVVMTHKICFKKKIISCIEICLKHPEISACKFEGWNLH